MNRAACLALAMLPCAAAPPQTPPDQIQLVLNYSERNGASGPTGLFGDMANSITAAMGAVVSLMEGGGFGGSQGIPKTSGELERRMASPNGLYVISLAPRSSSYRARVQAWLQWDGDRRAYLVKSGTLVWTATNNSRFEVPKHVMTSQLSSGGTHTLKPEDIVITFDGGGKATGLKKGAKAAPATYDLKLEIEPKGEPVVGESGWVAGGGGVYEAHAKYTTSSVKIRGTKDWKPTPDGNDFVAKPPEEYTTEPPEMFQHSLRYSADERAVKEGGASFAETWVDMTGASVSIAWQLTLPTPSVEIIELEQQGGTRTGDPAQGVFEQGKLMLKAKAQVRPFHDSTSLEWDAPAIGGTQAKVESDVKEGGVVEATLTYEGLPTDNGAFGSKTLKARVRKEEGEKRFQAFFEEKGKDNPEGQYPNWFYYWRQGAVPGLERFDYEEDPDKGGGYSPANRRLVVTSTSVGVIPALNALLRREDTFTGLHTYRLNRQRRERIDAVAAVVLHELRHKELFEMEGPPASDADGVKDAVEDASTDPWLDKTQANTYSNFDASLFFGDTKDYVKNGKEGDEASRQKAVDQATSQLAMVGDNELLAILAEAGANPKKNQDWAFPGSQAKGR